MVAKIAALHESWDSARYGYLPHPEQMYQSWLKSRATDPRSVLLVAEQAPGKLAGFLVGTAEREIPIYRLREFGFIHDLWVEPEYRNEGLARQMVMLAVERFRDMGMAQVRCETAQANEIARGLFARCGFRPSTVEMLLEIRKP
jgi:ribosomal protein S18 acetylase RimI-like enzyme